VQRLEYYDKDKGTKPKEVPDSLLKTFKTRNGRTVIDGRGIEPDVKVETEEISRLSISLLNGNHIFNYATEYSRNNNNIPDAGVFKFGEKEYSDFKNYLKDKDLKYTTASEESLKRWKETADKEGYFQYVKEDYEKMLERVTPSKERDLDKFKEEISQMLENEIVSRYYYQKGRILDAFRNDNTFQKALELFKNKSEFDGILK
jgi:carboxyl-terminal processing protease